MKQKSFGRDSMNSIVQQVKKHTKQRWWQEKGKITVYLESKSKERKKMFFPMLLAREKIKDKKQQNHPSLLLLAFFKSQTRCNGPNPFRTTVSYLHRATTNPALTSNKHTLRADTNCSSLFHEAEWIRLQLKDATPYSSYFSNESS